MDILNLEASIDFARGTHLLQVRRLREGRARPSRREMFVSSQCRLVRPDDRCICNSRGSHKSPSQDAFRRDRPNPSTRRRRYLSDRSCNVKRRPSQTPSRSELCSHACMTFSQTSLLAGLRLLCPLSARREMELDGEASSVSAAPFCRGLCHARLGRGEWAAVAHSKPGAVGRKKLEMWRVVSMETGGSLRSRGPKWALRHLVGDLTSPEA